MIFSVLTALILVGFVYLGRFFVSTEFWLYPYLIGKGLIPYKDLIDQHFPGVLFGPISFSSLQIDTVNKAIVSQILLLILLCVLSYHWFYQHTKTKYAWVLSLFFVASYYLLDGNHLWIEQWSLLLLIGALHLTNRSGFSNYLGGFLLAFAVINRPFAIGWALVIFLLSKDKTKTILGGLFYALAVGVWLYQNNLILPLQKIIFFSKTYYLEFASKAPNKTEILKTLAIIIPIFYFLKKQPVLWLAAIISLLGAWPRFEMYHLVMILMALFFVKIDKKNYMTLVVFTAGLFVVALLKVKPLLHENFYIGNEVSQITKIVDSYNASSLYIFGGPDQVYVLSNMVPAGKFYLPSLIWYHRQNEYADKQIEALKQEQGELVVINTNSVVDGKNLIDSSPRIYNYIVSHYKNTQTWNGYSFYLESEVVANKR